jgi:hypothetical protein
VARPGVVEVRTGAGRRLCLVSETHLLTAEDLDGAEPRDEHGRPLRLIYGYACPDGPVLEPDGTDLRHALSTALDVYRRYLVDEDRVTVVPSAPFTLRSRTTGWPVAASTARRRPVRLLVGAAALMAVAVFAVGAGIGGRGPAPDHSPEPSPSAPSSAPASPRVKESTADRRRRAMEPLDRNIPSHDQTGMSYPLSMGNR